MTYESIITHNDFDGVVSAAICSYVFKIDSIKFAGPNNIARADLTITDGDIVCDLPYPLECGLWFDHHEGNLQELKYRNIDPKSIPGKFDLQSSCARVVYNYFKASQNLPGYFETLVDETDIIDGFHYNSIEDWRKETPAKIIDATIRSRKENYQLKRKYLHRLVLWLRNQSVEEVAAYSEIQQRFDQYKREEKEILEEIPYPDAKESWIYRYQGFGRKEIAKMMGKSEESVKKYLQKGREFLEEHLKKLLEDL